MVVLISTGLETATTDTEKTIDDNHLGFIFSQMDKKDTPWDIQALGWNSFNSLCLILRYVEHNSFIS